MNENHEPEGQQYIKKSIKNGENVKTRSNQAGYNASNNNTEGYSGSHYGSRPMSQQSNVKSYYKK
jgi:hypothetical protein